MNRQKQGTYEQAVFAGGCFWCLEADMEKLLGVVEAVSGYSGGEEPDPTYEQVSSGRTGHMESVRVTYDPAVVDYAGLVRHFFTHIDPTDAGGQFVDRGGQYQSAIFYVGDEQQRIATQLKESLDGSGVLQKPVATRILPLTAFHPAEDYHQDYSRENGLRYQCYRAGSGRDGFLDDVWTEENVRRAFEHSEDLSEACARGCTRPSPEELKERLTPLQFHVTREEGTEPPFDNAYWNEKRAGVYVDVVSGEPLFSSTDKFDSGTGWPSFTRPIAPNSVTTREDKRLVRTRTEVRSGHADSHLGHVFEDGPPPTGLRYCINSAALRFVPVDEMDQEGLGEFKKLFTGGE